MKKQSKRSSLKRQQETELATNQWHRYVRARDNGHNEYLKTADKCNRFYTGDQWTPADLAKLQITKRPALTINMILPTVNAVLGEQTSSRVEFKYKPRNGGTETVATVLNKLMIAIRDMNNYDWVESQVFADSIIQHGRGFFDVRMNWTENMQGDVQIRADDPREIVLDPDAKHYDPATWKEVFETKWMSIDEIEQYYGRRKADELRAMSGSVNRFESDSIEYGEESSFGTARENEHMDTSGYMDEQENKTVRRVRVLERQHVRYAPVSYFVDPMTGEKKRIAETWSAAKISKFERDFNMAVIHQVEKRIRWTVTADRVVLHDDWSPYETFTKIPFFAYFRRGKPFGLVSNLLSPQEQLNKLSSQELHILNSTANSGWKVERGAITNMTLDDLKDSGAETGLVIETAAGRLGDVEKIQPNRPPTGVERAAQSSAQFLKEISGVNEAMLGFDSAEVSGVALQQKAQRGRVQIAVPFDNLQRSRFLLANKILELIQQFYTEERIFKITTDGMDFDSEEDQQFIINHKDASGKIVNDVTVGKYAVVLGTMPNRDSYDDAQFAEAIALRNVGVMVPDDRIVEYSHLAKKAELAEEMRSLQGRGKMTEEQMQQAQFEHEVQNRLAAAEVALKEAEVAKLETEIMKLQIDAQNEGLGLDSPEYVARMEELEMKLQVAREGNQLRRDLANLSAISKLDSTLLNTKAQVVRDRENERGKRATALSTLAANAKLQANAAKQDPTKSNTH